MPTGTRNQQIPGGGFHHVALQTRDWEGSLRLYRDVLGMQTVAEWGPPERHIMLLDMGDGGHMELISSPGATAAEGPAASALPYTHVALATTDTRQAIEHVRQAGYPVTVEPKTIDLGALTVTIAFFDGPNGESIEFFQTM